MQDAPSAQGVHYTEIDFGPLTAALWLAVRAASPLRPAAVHEEQRFGPDLGYDAGAWQELSRAVAELLGTELPGSAPPGGRPVFVADLVDLVDELLAQGSARPPTLDDILAFRRRRGLPAPLSRTRGV